MSVTGKAQVRHAFRLSQLAGCADRFLGLATQLALAYAIHKSLIFFRVPLAAAVTPKVVKVLRGWGWNIGKKVPPRAS
jgi:hypothetical protein